MNSICFPAYAKVNLYLDVLGKRPDGHHELLTLFERVDLADDLRVERSGPAGGLEFTCEAPGVPSDATNLAVRAAQLYREASGWNDGLRIRLEKKIPAGGGLGGGSSDAAAVLLALQQLSGKALAPERLMECARSLGADVAFFAVDVPWALGRERGDKIEPVALETSFWHLLATPGFPIPTKEVYRAFKLTPPRADATLLIRALEQRQIPRIRDLLFNALEPTVEALYPEMQRVKSDVETIAGLPKPMVSGSGSSVFALCESREEAESAAAKVKEQRPFWQVHAVKTT